MAGFSGVEIAERMTADEFFRDAPEERKAELIEEHLISLRQALAAMLTVP